MFFQYREQRCDRQHTIANFFSVEGIGIHSGKQTEVHILPGDPNQGIEFHLVSGWEVKAVIPATIDHVRSTQNRTVLTDEFHREISTPEHLLAALSSMGIDNAIVKVWGNEVPILDGSSGLWIDLIKSAGIQEQGVNRKLIKVLKEIKIEYKDTWCLIQPNQEFEIEYHLSYQHPQIGDQFFKCKCSQFIDEVSRARTFGFLEDIETLKENGLGKGASLSNTVVFDSDKIANPDGLRWSDEPVRHKVLDVIGDLTLAGYPIIGKFCGYKSGHIMNHQVLCKLLQDKTAWELIDV